MLTTSQSPMRTNLREKFNEGGERHIHIYKFYMHINILKRFIKTSEEPDIMLTKTKKKKSI